MNDLFFFFRTIRWQDLIDVLINSYIIFRLYVLFRGTNVVRVLIGIAFLWFLQRLAGYLGLIITSWAIQGVTAFAALIIIVVFRNEIRSVLQVKNLKTILWGIPRKGIETPVEIIVDSAYELARKRIGALIVLPGREDLGEAIHSGIPWQGLLSREMIISIFWHDGPVHDGAVIIEDDRITEVGAVLPLSHRKDLPSHYGTRHRAAAGLAESTDALVIVVSEERGNVVVAKGSRMSAIRRKEDLVQMLEKHIGVPPKQWRHMRKEKLVLGAAALVSILFISGIWFSFTRGLETLITLEIPVEYMNRYPAMEILNASVNAVRLHLSGPGALIKSIRPEQAKVKLDLSKGVIGRNTLTITPENITLPPGIFLKKVEPLAVDVTLDIMVKKELPIQVDWVGKLPEHLILTDASLTPEKIQVIGGNLILENVSTIYTEKLPLDNIEKPGTITLKLALEPASLKIAPGSKDRITVEYVVKERYP